MTARVKLAVTQGLFDTGEYVFTDRTVCTVGRAEDCDVRLPSNLVHMDVSRHHCVLDIDPPRVRVRDLGSRNGTYVNGYMIGQRPRHRSADSVRGTVLPEFPLHDGDEIRLGGTVFRVSIDTPEAQAAAAETPGLGAALAG